jgi:hypothetical protein
MDDFYARMAQDESREEEALEWSEGVLEEDTAGSELLTCRLSPE